MKSSRNRSRSKGNRNRTGNVGNIVNRVFDSSGPEGKVRGTPQQIIDKYNQLTRDAQLSNDRVAAENFQQHAEHYLRMLGEAQREQDSRRDQQNQQQNNQNGQTTQGNHADGNPSSGQHDALSTQDPDAQGGGGQGDDGQDTKPRNRRAPRGGDRNQPQAQAPAEPATDQPRDSGFDAVIDTRPGDDSGLVETPESAPKPKKPRTRRPRKSDDAPNADATRGEAPKSDGPDTPPQEAAE